LATVESITLDRLYNTECTPSQSASAKVNMEN